MKEFGIIKKKNISRELIRASILEEKIVQLDMIYDGSCECWIAEDTTEELKALATETFLEYGIENVCIEEVYWDASYGQGSGACIEYEITEKKDIKKFFKAAGYTKKEIKKIAIDNEYGNIDELWNNAVIKVKHYGGNYYHYNTTRFSIDNVYFYNIGNEALEEFNVSIQREIDKSLYRIYEVVIDYTAESNAERVIEEYLDEKEENDFIFLHNGTINHNTSYYSEDFEELVERYDLVKKIIEKNRLKRELDKKVLVNTEKRKTVKI